MRDDYLKGLLITCAGVLVLTPDALLIKLTGAMGPLESAFLRSLFMAVSWAMMIRIRHGAFLRPLFSVSRIGLLAGVLLAVDRVFFVAAVQMTTIANTLIIFAAVPAFTAVVAFLAMRERTSPVNVLAIAASLVGVAIICGSDLARDSLLGNGYAVLSAVFYALYLVCLRFAERDEVLESLFLSGLFGALCALPFIDPSAVSPASLGIVALQGLLLLPVGFALYFTGTRYLPAAEVALIGLLETVLAPVWGWAVIGEVPAAHAFLGGGVVVVAILGQALFGLSERRRPSPVPALSGE